MSWRVVGKMKSPDGCMAPLLQRRPSLYKTGFTKNDREWAREILRSDVVSVTWSIVNALFYIGRNSP